MTEAIAAPEATPQPAARKRSPLEPVHKVLRALGSSSVFFYAGIWLVVLVVVGTVAQADIGLYLAQQKYFSNWILWMGPIPLPGGQLTMTVIVVSLILGLIYHTKWRWDRAGIIVAHIGSLLLFLGGFVTAYFASEGSMYIPEGATAAAVDDYHALELAVTDTSNPEFDDVVVFGEGFLEPGRTIRHDMLPFELEVTDFYRNASATRHKGEPPPDRKGFARMFQLHGLPLEKEHERNRAGMRFRVTGTGEADGVYETLQGLRTPESIVVDGKRYVIELRRRRTMLPFQIQLIDFEKRMHPGTGMAKAYSSTVNLIENGTSRRVVIQMNEPLRHHGYTFYQSSFVEGQQGEATVLAVVKNVGRVFPYLSSIIICLGLLLHLLLKIPRLIRRSNET